MTSAQPQLLLYRPVMSGLVKCDGHGGTTQEPPEEDPITSVPLGSPQLQSWPAGGRLPCPRAAVTRKLATRPRVRLFCGHLSARALCPLLLLWPLVPRCSSQGTPQHTSRTANRFWRTLTATGPWPLFQGKAEEQAEQAPLSQLPRQGPTPLLAGEQNNHAGPGKASCNLWRRVLSSGGALVTVCTWVVTSCPQTSIWQKNGTSL